MRSQTGDLVYREVDASNIDLAVKIQHQVWPHEPVKQYYIDKPLYPEGGSNVSWIVYYGHAPIGITGVSIYDPDELGYDEYKSIWMDWFAILPEFRGRGFGKQVLLDTIEYCRKLGRFEYFRLDTTFDEDRPAIGLYDRVMQYNEPYTAEDTPSHPRHCRIYSYSLHSAPMKPWNNQPLELNYEAEEYEVH